MTARIRCTVESMHYSACAMAVGDHVDIDARGVSLEPGRGFCLFAITAVASAMAGRDGDTTLRQWAAGEPLVACPDPPENLLMRVRLLPEEAEAPEGPRGEEHHGA
ncbi:TIGR04076 family protein [Streptomyces sp. NPDC058045]|uniref:TIGR04076 family protein n=1 Tax=Streptomyces sp. NPDC058045 TaxID=3346311 RepID=UPI0036ECE63C